MGGLGGAWGGGGLREGSVGGSGGVQVGANWGGGGGGGRGSWRPRTRGVAPPPGLNAMFCASKTTHSGRNTQRSFDPHSHPPQPPPPSPQKGIPGSRGGGQKIHWGIIFCTKMRILQGVGHPIPQLGACYANNPQKGGVYDTRACA